MAIEVPDFRLNDPRLWYYRVQVTRVVDGDTLDVLVDKGFGNYRRERLRLLGVDTPELRPRRVTPEEREREKAAAKVSKARVEELVGGREVIIRTSKAGKYGRWLAIVYLPPEADDTAHLRHLMEQQDPPSLNQLLLDEGLAEPYPSK